MRGSWAASGESSRLALVIGNSAYRDGPLANPGNDARAMAGLFDQAGFAVDSHLDLTRADMMAAIGRFGTAISRPETKQVVFYYAGHGVQLDWRNYLLPVDAQVDTADQIKQRCVDLGLLLEQLSAANDKTFIIILDACRNNPFSGGYRPEQKGLSQFDAPVGSLLAYATAPGNVASDGSGKNGLYTENLVREFSVRGTRIEDALKRVRLNVRLTSHGAQIPWETTSLESDFFLFNDGQKKFSDAELEKQIEADIAAWNAIKSSRKIEDWVGYLRSFPNGRFAEIAQMRLASLLAVHDKPAKVSVAAPVMPVIEFAAGGQAPQLLQPSANPYSAGSYPLGRKYTVGDEATFRESDLFTGAEQRTYTQHVTRVDQEADRVEINHGKAIWDLMGNVIKAGDKEFDVPQQFTPAEFQVGKKWTAAFVRTRDGSASSIYYDLHIVRREKVSVPAGTFDAFRIEGRGWNTSAGKHLEMTLWLVPGLNFPVRHERLNRNRKGRLKETERHELVSLRQQASGI
jgi:hypothetical protein